jgi:hypothetical protein
MRRAGKLVVLLTLAAIGFANWSLIAAGLSKVANRLILYVHVARLYTREPDSKLTMPIQNVSKKDIADTWLAARGEWRRHEGQDIFAPRGMPILSATTGYVMNVGENRLGGLTVSVVGNGGRVYYYAHLDSYAANLAVGDHVTEQTVLGYVGTTGNAQGTPPHLHFGVYSGTGAINPLPLLANRPTLTVNDRTDETRSVNNPRRTGQPHSR